MADDVCHAESGIGVISRDGDLAQDHGTLLRIYAYTTITKLYGDFTC
jgi:hypothetical protein